MPATVPFVGAEKPDSILELLLFSSHVDAFCDVLLGETFIEVHSRAVFFIRLDMIRTPVLDVLFQVGR